MGKGECCWGEMCWDRLEYVVSNEWKRNRIPSPPTTKERRGNGSTGGKGRGGRDDVIYKGGWALHPRDLLPDGLLGFELRLVAFEGFRAAALEVRAGVICHQGRGKNERGHQQPGTRKTPRRAARETSKKTHPRASDDARRRTSHRRCNPQRSGARRCYTSRSS